MKKIIKVLCLALVMVMVFAPLTSLAEGNSFKGYTSNDSPIAPEITEYSQAVYGTVRAIGIAVAVVMTVYMGIQWMIATPAKKAELKGRMWYMAIGVVLLLGGVAILGIVESFVNNSSLGQG